MLIKSIVRNDRADKLINWFISCYCMFLTYPDPFHSGKFPN